MKTLKSIHALTFAALFSLFPLSTLEARTVKVEVNGLVCAFCAKGIIQAFKKEPAAGEVFVSLENKLVAIEFKEGQNITDETIKKLLTNAGYTVVGLLHSDETMEQIKSNI